MFAGMDAGFPGIKTSQDMNASPPRYKSKYAAQQLVET
jgi:hypothetical protein